MKNTARIQWLEAAYTKIRDGRLEEAPPSATLSIGYPSKRRIGKFLAKAGCDHDRIEGGEAFGDEHLLVIHPIAFDEPLDVLVQLTYAMVRASLEADVGHGKEFKTLAERVGILKPWGDAGATDELGKFLSGVLEALGPLPAGHYVPPPPAPKRPSTIRKLRCGCMPARELSLSYKKLEDGSILCGICTRQFRVHEPDTDADA